MQALYTAICDLIGYAMMDSIKLLVANNHKIQAIKILRSVVKHDIDSIAKIDESPKYIKFMYDYRKITRGMDDVAIEHITNNPLGLAEANELVKCL